MTTTETQIPQGMHKFLERQEWTAPRPIQSKVWAWFANEQKEGRDLIVSAPTAVGKTEAIFFPLLDRIDRSSETQGFEILYICPLTALIDQQSRRLHHLAQIKKIGAFGLHAKTQKGRSAKAVKKGGILITTPESLEGILRKGESQRLLRPLKWIVVDEIHAFFGNTRGVQLISQMARIDSLFDEGARPVRVAASATLSDEAADKAKAFFRPGQPERVDMVRDSHTVNDKATGFEILSFMDEADGPHGTALAQIEKTLIDDVVKPLRTGEAEFRKALMFCNSRRLVERLTVEMRKRVGPEGDKLVFPHHGSLEPAEKKRAEDALRDENGRHLVISTSTLELGIDIGEIDLVLQLDPGPTVASLRQRLGRAGRRHGNIARFCMYVRAANQQQDDSPLARLNFDLFQSLAQLWLVQASAFESPEDGPLNLSTFAQQILSMAFMGTTPEQIERVLIENGPFRTGAKDIYDLVISYLGSNRPHWLLPALDLPDPANAEVEPIYLTERGREFTQTKKFGTSFLTTTTYVVRLGAATLGTIPIGHNLRAGDALLFAGRMLRVRSVRDKPPTLFVEPGDHGRPPPFAGVGMAPSELVVKTMRELYAGRARLPEAHLSETTQSLVEDALGVVRKHGLDKRQFIELGAEAGTVLLPWVGQKAQSTLGLILRAEGIRVIDTSVTLVLPDLTKEAVRKTCERFEARKHPDADSLIRALPTHKFDRYDYLLSQHCQRLNYISAQVDIEGAQRAAGAIARSMD